ncbi:MAG: hypothetical protein KC503_36845 [Myxococcales bacterium]|nr:hypothetical protein [Myxococcales bacterium]
MLRELPSQARRVLTRYAEAMAGASASDNASWPAQRLLLYTRDLLPTHALKALHFAQHMKAGRWLAERASTPVILGAGSAGPHVKNGKHRLAAVMLSEAPHHLMVSRESASGDLSTPECLLVAPDAAWRWLACVSGQHAPLLLASQEAPREYVRATLAAAALQSLASPHIPPPPLP